MSERMLTFNFPLPRTHTGVALGNGNFGTLVWGKEPNCLNLTVSRNDFWDHRFGGQLAEGGTFQRLVEAYQRGESQSLRKILSPHVAELRKRGARASTLLPCGRFECELTDTPSRAILNGDTGTLQIVFHERNAIFELILSPFENLLWIKDPAGLIINVTPRPAWEWNEEEFIRRKFTAPTVISETGTYGWAQTCPEDPALCALAKQIAGGWAIALTLEEDESTAINRASQDIAAFEQRDKTEFLSESETWWQTYWSRTPEIHIPSEFFSRFLLYAQYKFACATNPNSPKPAPLQGPWIEEYQFPPWGADYTCNVNIQQIYTMTFTGGNLDHLMPLFDMIESEPFQNTMKHNAKVLLDIDDGLLLTHTVNDHGKQCQIGFTPHSALDQAVPAWLGHLYYLYYQYTGDQDFLRERAYPFLYGVMRVYEAMLEERDDGTLYLPLSVSPEYGVTGFKNHHQEGPNASMQLACIHMLVNALNESSKVLNLEPRPIWQEIKERLPLFATFGPEDQKRIAIWEGQDLSVCHRHHSHLGAIYPFDLSAEMSDAEKQITANAIEHWIRMGMGAWSEWCFPWAALIETRMGMREGPLALLEIWKNVFINEGLTTVYLPRFHGVTAHRFEDIDLPKESHEIMQLEGTAGGATAIVEMLVHTHGGITKIFPSTSERWADASFKRVPQPGGFEVDAIRQHGQTQSAQITSHRGGTIVIDIPDRKSMTLHQADASCTITFPHEIQMNPAETVQIVSP